MVRHWENASRQTCGIDGGSCKLLIVTSGCCVHVRPFLLGIMLLSRLLSLGVVAEPPYAIKSDRGDSVAPSPPNHQLQSDEIRYRIVIIKLWLRGSGRDRVGVGSWGPILQFAK